MDIDQLTVRKGEATPAYLQLKEQLAAALERGDIAPGEALPSERDLAASLGVSRMTVRRAVEELIAERRLERRHGSGTFVLPRRHEQRVDRVLGFGDEAAALGVEPGSRLLEAISVPADRALAELFGAGAGAPLLRITRLRTADDAPLALQVAHLAPELSDLPLDELRASGSLYRTLATAFGIRPHRARQTVSARLPTYLEARLLGIDEGAPVLSLERTTFGADDRPFEFVRSAYRSDRYQMSLDLRAPDVFAPPTSDATNAPANLPVTSTTDDR